MIGLFILFFFFIFYSFFHQFSEVSSIADHNYFSIGFSGGSLPNQIGSAMSQSSHTWAVNQWFVMFCDERCVKHNDVDSNYAVCNREVFSKLNVPQERIIKINEQLVNQPKLV